MTKLDKKFSIIIILFTLIAAGFLWSVDKDRKKQLEVTKLSSSDVAVSNKPVTDYIFDSITISDNICTIKGWAFVKGVDSRDVVPAILLVDDENNFYKVTTRIIQREDVTRKFNDGKTYTNSGITSRFSIKNLDKNRKYKLLIQLKIGGTVYSKQTNVQLPLK